MTIRTERVGGVYNKPTPDVTVFLHGDLDIYSSPQLATALNEAMDDGALDILIDFRNVSYVDMSGLGTMVRAFKRLQSVGGSIMIAGANASITKVLNVTGLVRIFRVYADTGARDGDAA